MNIVLLTDRKNMTYTSVVGKAEAIPCFDVGESILYQFFLVQNIDSDIHFRL